MLGRGGLEVLVDGRKKLKADVPEDKSTLGDLIQWVRSTYIKERVEMFMQGDSL